MSLTLKENLNLQEPLVRAARRRAADELHKDYTEAELDNRTKSILARHATQLNPPIIPGLALNSFKFREFIKDTKYTIGTLAGQSSVLEEEINAMAKTNFALLDDIQRDVDALDSDITEEEVKTLHGFTQTHYNAFVRPVDGALSFVEKDWIVDFKTEVPFLAWNMASVIPGAGVTLPVFSNVVIPLKDVTLVAEETDYGDTNQLIQSTSPRNLMFPNQIFRHVLIRRDFDDTSRLYDHSGSQATFSLELPGIQLVNTLSIRPLGHNTVKVASLSYLNEAGEEVSLSSVAISAERLLTLMFEPVRTRFLKIKFTQSAPVERLAYTVGDPKIRRLNEAFEGVGFSQRLVETTEEIQGRVYDFSMEEFSVGLRVYSPLGVYRSKPRPLVGPVTLELVSQVEAINVSADQRTYGNRFALADNEVLLERYLGLHLENGEGGTLYHDLIPLPDTYPLQKEWLPVHGGESRLKLFPDLLWNLIKFRVTSATFDGTSWTVVTAEDHGVPVAGVVSGGGLGFFGPIANGFNGISSSYEAIDTTTLVITPTTVPSPSVNVDAGTTPYAWVYVTADQSSPLNVYKEDTELALGSDYELSLDGGSTWLSALDRDQELSESILLARAGKARIKLLAPEYDKRYWIQYRVAKTQALGKGSEVRLKNGKVLVDRDLENSRGTVSTVTVLRAQSDSPYITPVLLNYFLRVREKHGA